MLSSPDSTRRITKLPSPGFTGRRSLDVIMGVSVSAQNAEIPGGRVEQGPETLTLRTLGRVTSVEEFEDIGAEFLIVGASTIEEGLEILGRDV